MMPSWISSRLLQWLLVLAALGALAASLWMMAQHIDAQGYARAEAIGKQQIAQLKAEQLEAQRRAEAAARERIDAQNRHMLRLSEQLITAKSTIDAQGKRLQERAKDVSTLYRPQPGADLAPVPGWIVTYGWLCDYNRAIGYGLPDAGTGVGGNEIPACAADPFGRTRITAEHILRHHIDYGGYCRKLEEQVNRWIDHDAFIQGQQPAQGGGNAGSR